MQIKKLKEVWFSDNKTNSNLVSNQDILMFQNKYTVILPKDLVEYFVTVNGTNGEYDDLFFQFYSLNKFKSIDDELKNWAGLPDYSGIVDTLPNYKQYFVFSDYSFHMFSYAIYLSNYIDVENTVILICGDKYRKISSSFSDFIELYLSNSGDLQSI